MIRMNLEDLAEHRIELLASIVESSEDAIVSFLLNGTVLSWNRGAQKLFGYSVEMTMGKTLRHLIGPEMDNVITSLDRGDSHRIQELAYTANDGRQVCLSLRVSPIKGEDGRVTGGAAIFRDITAAKLFEKELIVTSERLEQIYKELQEFTWVVAHDLKEPIRNVATYARLLDQEHSDKLEDEAKQFIQYIGASSEKALERLDAVLSYSALDKEEVLFHPVELELVVNGVLDKLKAAILTCDAQVEVSNLPTVLGKAD